MAFKRSAVRSRLAPLPQSLFYPQIFKLVTVQVVLYSVVPVWWMIDGGRVVLVLLAYSLIV